MSSSGGPPPPPPRGGVGVGEDGKWKWEHSPGAEIVTQEEADAYDNREIPELMTVTHLLNDATEMPRVGYGLYEIPASEAKALTLKALELGYRHLDCASFYGNEKEVGEAIAESGLARKELYVASKVWTDCIGAGPKAVRASILKSLEFLKVDYLDCAYVHWPCEGHVEAYKALERLKDEGKVKSLGLSNYRVKDYLALEPHIRVTPVVNQIEANPWLYRRECIGHFGALAIRTVAYKPLLRGKGPDKDPTIDVIAEQMNCTPAQVLLRWGIDRGFVILPRSTNHDRMKENISINHLEFTQRQMDFLNSLTNDDAIIDFEDHFQKRAVIDPKKPTLAVYGGGET